MKLNLSDSPVMSKLMHCSFFCGIEETQSLTSEELSAAAALSVNVLQVATAPPTVTRTT